MVADGGAPGAPGTPPDVRSRRLLIAGGAIGLALVAVIAVLAFLLGGALAPPRSEAAPTAAPTPSATAPTVTELYETVGPSVVVVRTAAGSLGSGVVVGEDGTILTANHVVADGSAITVRFADGTESAATVRGADPSIDTAALLPETLPQPLVPAVVGGGVAVGQEVVAIGNPLGLTYSVSDGVVSGLDRVASDVSGLIQFDAAVNPGSSGGPLIDGATGAVVGIVLSIADPGGDDAFAGIGFAVPIAQALGGGGMQIPL